MLTVHEILCAVSTTLPLCLSSDLENILSACIRLLPGRTSYKRDQPHAGNFVVSIKEKNWNRCEGDATRARNDSTQKSVMKVPESDGSGVWAGRTHSDIEA